MADKKIIKLNKTHIIAIIILLTTIVFALAFYIYVTNIQKEELKNELKEYLTNECRLVINEITLTKKEDYSGNFEGYNACIYCENLDTLTYDEMTSVAHFYDSEDIFIDKIIFNGDSFSISSYEIKKNGDTVYNKEESFFVSLKCDHQWSSWEKKTRCDYNEYIHCNICGEEHSRRAENQHNFNSYGYCPDCGYQKVVHNCIECYSIANYSYTSPFSGQKEYYCYTHYKALKELLEQFGMD